MFALMGPLKAYLVEKRSWIERPIPEQVEEEECILSHRGEGGIIALCENFVGRLNGSSFGPKFVTDASMNSRLSPEHFFPVGLNNTGHSLTITLFLMLLYQGHVPHLQSSSG